MEQKGNEIINAQVVKIIENRVSSTLKKIGDAFNE